MQRFRSSGQPLIGGSASPAAPARRNTPTPSKPLRSTNALTKCVVPIITPSISAAWTAAASSTARVALTMPLLTSPVVGRFAEANTVRPETRTASVFVPLHRYPIAWAAVYVGASPPPSAKTGKTC